MQYIFDLRLNEGKNKEIKWDDILIDEHFKNLKLEILADKWWDA